MSEVDVYNLYCFSKLPDATRFLNLIWKTSENRIFLNSLRQVSHTFFNFRDFRV